MDGSFFFVNYSCDHGLASLLLLTFVKKPD